MQNIYLTKMTGLGNDFLLLEALEPWRLNRLLGLLPQGLGLSGLAQTLCDRHRGIGADGLVVLAPPRQVKHRFRWEFFNSDGSSAEMCGNAARCVARYAFDRGLAETELAFETIAGVIRAWNHGADQVTVETTTVTDYRPGLKLTLDQQTVSFDRVNTGIPHVVLVGNQWRDQQACLQVAPELRHHPDFQPQGTNVTFVCENQPGSIESFTYERGVEAITLACGTGALAAAYCWQQTQPHWGQPVKVKLPGGELTIDLQQTKPLMQGEAKFIADVVVDLENFYGHTDLSSPPRL